MLRRRPLLLIAAVVALLAVAGVLRQRGASHTVAGPAGSVGVAPGTPRAVGPVTTESHPTPGTGTPTTTTALPVAASTTSPPAATVAIPSSSTVPSTTPATGVAECLASELDLTTASDSPSYAPGATVGLLTNARNVSGRTCQVTNGCPRRSVTVEDGSGAVVWESSRERRAGVCLTYADLPRRLAPGESFALKEAWDQRRCPAATSCPATPVPPGSYVARGRWSQGDAAPTTFEITGE